jgi:hypothetical protein
MMKDVLCMCHFSDIIGLENSQFNVKKKMLLNCAAQLFCLHALFECC